MMFRLCRKQMAPPYSDTARRLAQQLAEKASRNLRQSGWAIDIDASGRFCAHRPSEQGDPPTQRRRCLSGDIHPIPEDHAVSTHCQGREASQAMPGGHP